LVLVFILLVYAVVGVLYAVYTPPWQVPDEPAHYNYIRAIAEDGILPVMEQGDYDQDYLERITDQQDPFPPELSIDPLTYEDHQPPLYYLLTAPVYLLFDGALLPLRLVSVAAGMILLIVAFGLIRDLFPGRRFLAIAAIALIAFIPQHVAMTAGVNNDALAEVAVGAALWMAVRYASKEVNGRRFLITWGLILALAVLTKTSAYVALPVALLAVKLRARRQEHSLGWAAEQAGWVFLVAGCLAGAWLIRNVVIYGLSDPLGLVHHNAVVVGQPRTTEWLTQYGWAELAEQFLRTTFQSFWGQFGWMGVPLQLGIYLALVLFSALLFTGWVGWLVDRQRSRLTSHQQDGLVVLAASALLTVASYLWYNLTFVQHQGRYLFPALIPLTLGAALGLEWLLSHRVSRWTAAGLGAVGGILALWRLVRGDPLAIPTEAAFGLAVLFGLPALLPRRGRWLTVAVLAIGLVALDLYALFWAIVPTLTR
jgi:4-amino-4-deoxy-L-arabinose transferase-like glycosyltransferase